ncbi:beta-galactosidase [Nocardioides sp. GCM10027113]|uniref:beta-galactosidase n=1 Tax=unclassified Nocardioides TaxID=2615069 RepID=UPI00360848F4
MPAPLPTMAFGGDYNPEQWPLDVQLEDVELMKEAGYDLATLAVFAWAKLEPAPGEFDLEWLDEVVERLHGAGVRIDLATATASPPPWLAHRHPETLPVTADGTTLWPGARQAYCPSSPVYREHALRLVRELATRYGSHEGLALWHVGNESGCHVARCYCDTSAAAFRTWLQRRYGDIEALNEAWGTAFWSQRYGSFDEVNPPRSAPAFPNPTQQLDFHRFSSDQLIENYVAERDLLRELSPGVPVTTNFMVTDHIRDIDYFAFAREVDLVTNDHYLRAEDPQGWRELAFCSDLVRGVAGGDPWLLMETSTSAVNWQPRNIAKRPGQLLRNAMAHVARGSDGILFFQWRASRAGAEKFHSGLVPHAGTDTRLWREVVDLSRRLDDLEEVAGARAANRAAILFDWEAWWACELDSHPSTDVRYIDRAHAFHAAFVDRQVGVDVVHPGSDLSAYDLIVVPTLYTITDAAADALRAAVERGAVAVVTYFSGIVDEHDHIRLGGYPGAFRDLLGVMSEEFLPLRADEQVRLSDGTTADVWAEDLHLRGAEAVVTYTDGPVPGTAAVTRHQVGDGVAWYAATRLDEAATGSLVERALDDAGIGRGPVTPGVEVVRRVAEDGRRWAFVINHTDDEVPVALSGHDLMAGAPYGGTVAAGGVAVVRED